MRLLCTAFAICLSMAVQAQTTTPPPASAVSPEQAAQAAKDAQRAAATQKAAQVPPSGTPVVLDSVVAIINGEVLLQSDVEQERRLEELQLLPNGQDTDERAAQHLITRTLILQQMKQQGQVIPETTAADVNKVLDEMKHQLPGCEAARCQTDAGWTAFLAQRQLTPQEVTADWKLRLQILSYLNLRFRTGIRIPNSEIRTYYDQTLVPQFQAKHVAAPSLKSLTSQIREVLLQRQVSKQIDAWRETLLQQGSIRILVPAYGQSNANADAEDDDIPGAV